jgi:hypothetical protein
MVRKALLLLTAFVRDFLAEGIKQGFIPVTHEVPILRALVAAEQLSNQDDMLREMQRLSLVMAGDIASYHHWLRARCTMKCTNCSALLLTQRWAKLLGECEHLLAQQEEMDMRQKQTFGVPPSLERN